MNKHFALIGSPLEAGAKLFFHPLTRKMMVNIKPGEIYVSSKPELISTILGSCISACIWDPFVSIGGMNHFMLPFGDNEDIKDWLPTQWYSKAGRYGNYAMELLINTLIKRGALKSRLKVKVFGGSVVSGNKALIGYKNTEFIREYIRTENLSLVSENLGGEVSRKIIFDPITGKVFLKRLNGSAPEVRLRELEYEHLLIHKIKGDDEGNTELF